MTIHEALWFIDQVKQYHDLIHDTLPVAPGPRNPRQRFTRHCLYKNVHPNQELFATSDGGFASEGEFAACLSKLKKEKCIELIDRYVVPADSWVEITPKGHETLKLFAEQCPFHHFVGRDQWSRRPPDQRCSLDSRSGASAPHPYIDCHCDQ